MLPGKIRKLMHQITESAQRLGRAPSHAFDLLHMLHAIEERRTMGIRIRGDQPLGASAQATLRHIEDTPHVHVIRRIHNRLQIRESILDFPAFVELGSADQLIWQIGLDQRLLQRARLRIGAIHDRDVAIGHRFLTVDTADFVRDPAGLLLRIVRGIADDLVSRAECGPQFLRLAILVLCDHRIRRIQNRLCGTIVLLKHDGLRVREILFEILNIANIRATERVDGLVGITDDGDPRRSNRARAPHSRIGFLARIDAAQLTYQHILRMIRVLVFVDENVAEPVSVILGHLWATLKQFHRAHDQIIEINGVRHGQAMLVLGIHHGDQFLDVAIRDPVTADTGLIIAVHGLQLVPPAGQRVLAIGNPAKDHARRIPLHVNVQIGADEFEQSFAISRVIYGEARFEADLITVSSQDAHACGVEGGDPHAFGFRAYKCGESFLHFRRGLVGEGDGEDAAGPETMRQEPCDASGQHAGLARAGSRADEQCLSVIFDRFFLLRVEILDQTLRVA